MVSIRLLSVVPKRFLSVRAPEEALTHIKWLLQKEILGQDVFLIGVPGALRSGLILQYLELCNREYEYLAVTRDTTEGDIKQRREIRGGTAFYTDLCAVRAALNGRVLVIDGVEKAERNVLPILNNLLENREMQLDDGRFLMRPDKYDKLTNNYTQKQLTEMGIERVSERFHVVALGLPVPRFRGNSLDPPLRSRFQCRNIPEPSFESVRRLCESLAPNLGMHAVNDLLSVVFAINSQQDLGLTSIPVEKTEQIIRIWNTNPSYSAQEMFSLIYPYRSMYKDHQIKVTEDFIKKFLSETQVTGKASIEDHNFVSTPSQEAVLAKLAIAHSQGDFALLGAKGAGKTKLISELAYQLGFNTDTMILYQDMNARDLLQRRLMLDNGDTLWEDSQLVSAAKRGDVCVLDGAERVHWSALGSLANLCYHRNLFLPDGSRLVSSEEFDNIQKRTGYDEAQLNSRGVFRIPNSFRLVLLGNSSLTENKWLDETVMSMMPFISMPKLSIEDQCAIVQGMVSSEASGTTQKLVKFVEKLRSSGDAGLRGVAESLSMRKLIHIAKQDCLHPGELRNLVEKAALAKFLPSVTRLAFYTELDKSGFVKEPSKPSEFADDVKYLLDQDASSEKHETMIPDVLFYENDQHMGVIRDMARDMRLGSHLLLIGNQGVGKNKIADRFLHLIQRPRQYMQLHRDTTVETITMQTTVENGVLRYEDSALVRAARAGHVLVIDEADKAPLHVIAILKSLLDSGTLLLGDGRRIQPASAPPSERSIPLHPNFRIIMLANRPGFPFLGNDLFALLGDLFSVHTVDNPNRENELEMLKKYAPNVDDGTLLKLMAAFTELREMADEELLHYPYSTRELVNIVKHINKFPDDSVPSVIRNVFDFDAFTAETISTIRSVFQKHGISFGIERPRERVFLSHRFLLQPSSSVGEWGVRDNIAPVSLKTTNVALNLKREIPLNGQALKLKKEHMRVQQFTEQECAWQIPMLDVNICSDGLVMGNSLIVAAVNPLRLYFINDLDLAEEVVEFDISSAFSQLRQVLKYQPRVKLAKYADGVLLMHEEVTNSTCLVNLNKNTIQPFGFESSTLSGLTSVFSKDENRLVRSTCPLLYNRDGKEIFRFSQDGMVTHMQLLDDIGGVFPVDSDKILVKLKTGACELLCHESGHWKSRAVQTDFKNTVDINGLQVQGDSAFLSADGYHFLKSSGFPRLFSSTDLIGSSRPAVTDVVDARHPHYLSDENVRKFVDPQRNFVLCRDGVVIRALPTWKTPKDAVGEGRVNIHQIGGFLEAVDTANNIVQYIPVPEPYHQSYHGSWLAAISQTPFIIVPFNDERLLTVDTCGGIRSYELSAATLGRSFQEWTRLIGEEDEQNLRLEFEREADAFDISKLDDPKIGKFDPANAPHHGGNQWMGGTGGYSTAGLGGVGGPFRLDAGHDVHQMPESAKRQVPEHILKKAREIAKAEYQKKLKEIAMSEYDADAYMSLWDKIEKHSIHLRTVIEQLEAKKKERQWARHQTSGDLDDGKLIEGITGEKNIYRRRMEKEPEVGSPQLKPKRLRLCFDVSGSMYRFNGYDKRLQRSLEAALMVMTSFEGKQDKVAYDIVGHSGDGPCTEFVTSGRYPKNNKERLDILKQMLAHTQYCASGDYTVEGLDAAIKTLSKEKDCDERIVVLISDANLERYGISPKQIVKLMHKDDSVNSFVILIGSLGLQAQRLQSALPVGKAYVCENTSDLPKIMQSIFTYTLG
ncbi:hypothetical protein Q1695_000475 [Nippostrongylus brasiliensis]|nr:hypothetical protein Q1695_000475 [Nippostrongylus brasiliensis]